MKIAYLVLAHKDPQLLRRTIGRLSSGNCTFFIHIDQKSSIEDFRAMATEKVLFSEKRLPVFWGEFSVVESVLLLMHQALGHSPHYDYFVLLSGSDYPLRSAHYIQSFFEENRGTEFMSLVKMPNEAAGQPISKINKIWIQSDRPVRRFALRVLAKAGMARRDYRKYLGNLEPYAGDMWWALTRDACQYITEFVKSNRHVEEFFRATTAPDEMFFHTVLGNSPFAPQLRRNLHFADWSEGGSHPATIDDRHITVFEANEKVCLRDVWGSGEVLFARKFSIDRPDLLQRIDDMIMRKESN